jgi:cytochrome P450
MARGPGKGWANLGSFRKMTVLLDSISGSGEGVVVFRLGPRRLALVADPAAAAAVLRAEQPGVAERGRFYHEIERVVGSNSLLTVSGERHARLRSVLAPTFGAERIDDYAPRITAAADALQLSWRDGQTVDIGAEMARLT